jgi:CBS domain-containing protein
MNVEAVMTKDVLTVRPEASLKDAAEIMARERISGLPVVDEQNHVLGVVSEGDILFKERGAGEKGWFERWFGLPDPELASKLAARTVGEAMSTPAVTITPRRPLSVAAATMIDERVKRLPVVDASGRLVGIVTRADLVRAFVRSDEVIAREIREDVIRRVLWMDPVLVQVVVDHGEVQLSGQVETKADAELLPTMVQRVPGVVSVLSKLDWPAENGDRGRLARHAAS